MTLIEHAKRELELAGLFDKDSDYGGMIGDAVMELIETFSKQGHSGYSAQWVNKIFNELANYKTLVPIENNESEWMDMTKHQSSIDDAKMYQHSRDSRIFKEISPDGKIRSFFIDGIHRVDPDGWITNESVDITFPYIPSTKTVYTDYDGNLITFSEWETIRKESGEQYNSTF